MTQFFMGGGFGESIPSVGGSINAGRAFFQVPNMAVTINDGGAINATLLGCTITYGFDIGISTATIEVTAANIAVGGAPTDPTGAFDGLNYYDNVKIYCGDANNPLNSNALRFSGVYLRAEATMWPSVFRIICKGMLWLAATYYQAQIFTGVPASFFPDMPIGLPPVDFDPGNSNPLIPGYLPGATLGSTATDQNLICGILSHVAQATKLRFDPANIGGTGLSINYSAFAAFWPPYKSAWEMIQMFDSAFLGYRTYESCGGIIHRSQIYGYPSGPADFQFVEGVDIFEAQGTRSVEQLINSSYVEGMTSIAGQNIGDLQVVFAYVPSGNDLQTNPVVEQFSSPFIETSDGLDPGGAVSALRAEDVARWRLAERNRELVNVQFTTFRDILLGAGRTITINSPHAAVTEPVWVQRVEIQVQANPPLFQQTITGLGGGIAGNAGLQAPTPASIP